MLITLSMPQFGESITSGRIVHWLKQSGDPVKEGEALVELETEKTVFAYESPFTGKLSQIVGQEESEVSVGDEIARFEVSDQDGKKYISLGAAREAGAGMAPVPAAAAPQASPVPPAPKNPEPKKGVKIIPVTPVRSRIADNMVLSTTRVPHAGTGLFVDLTRVDDVRKKDKIGFLPYVVHAALQAVKAHPLINSLWKEEGGRRWIEQYEHVHLGIATATPQGLIVPVIRNAEQLSLQDLAKEVARVTEGGRQGSLSAQEMTGGTLTVNNTGVLGATRSIQVIPPNQSAILAVNRVVKRPWVVNDQIVIRQIASLDLEFDHRLIDGEDAIGYLVTIQKILEGWQ